MTPLLLALGLVIWPAPAPRLPWHRVTRAGRRWTGPPVGPVTVPAGGAGVGVIIGVLLNSPPAGVAAAMVGATVAGLIRSAASTRRRRRDAVALTAAIRALAREVHVGSDLDTAITAVRATVGLSAAAVLGGLMVSAADPGSRPSSAAGLSVHPVHAPLAAAVRLSRRVGAPLSALLARLAEGLADEQQATDERATAVAGARLSGWVLAALPVMGVLLGMGMGADPLPVLVSDGIGGALLVVGSLLLCTGLLWSARIARAPW